MQLTIRQPWLSSLVVCGACLVVLVHGVTFGGDNISYGATYVNDLQKADVYGSLGQSRGAKRILHFVDQQVALLPPKINKFRVKDRKLRAHIRKYMKHPVVLKCYAKNMYTENTVKTPTYANTARGETQRTDRNDKNDDTADRIFAGFLATAKLSPTRKLFSLRKQSQADTTDTEIVTALWREANPTEQSQAAGKVAQGKEANSMDYYCTATYEEALQVNNPEAEFELILPPLHKGNGQKNVHVVYKCLTEKSNVDFKAIVPKTQATMSIYPNGKTENRQLSMHDEVISEAGVGYVNTGMRNGLVDSSWALLRKPFFRAGRNGAGKI